MGISGVNQEIKLTEWTSYGGCAATREVKGSVSAFRCTSLVGQYELSETMFVPHLTWRDL